MTIRPLLDRILVERTEQDERTPGGIIIPDAAKEKPKQGKVIAVGPGAKDEHGDRIPMDVRVGDTVLFSQWSGAETRLGDAQYLVLKESDVIGIIE
jgi:chaperonin GroES